MAKKYIADEFVKDGGTSSQYLMADGSTSAGTGSEVNDLTSSVTWADVPDANITESSVTQHESAIEITESQISDLGSYIDGSGAADYIPKFSDSDTLTTSMMYQDGTNGIAIGKFNASEKLDVGGNIIADAFKVNGGGSGDVLLGNGDLGSYISSHTSLQDIGTNTHAQIDTHIADATLHFTQASISITESQISDLGSYMLASQQLAVTKVLAAGEFFTSYNSVTGLFTSATPPDTIYTHPNHTGDVTSTGDGATVIAANAVTNTKLNSMAANTIKGRISSLGDPQDLTANQVRTILNVADGANNYVHPTGDGNLHVPANSTTNNGKVLTSGASAGVYTWETIPAGVTDHTLLSNIGTNTHAQIDTHIGDSTIHFTQASISITESQISDLGPYTNNDGTVTSVSVGTGLDVSNASTTPSVSLNLSELTDMTADIVGTDEIIILDNGAERRKAISEFKISVFNNDSGFIDDYTVTSGDVTAHEGDLSIGVSQVSGINKAYVDALNVDADTLDGIDSSSFVRSDASDTITGIHYYESTQVIKDTHRIDFGTGNDMRIYHSSNQNYIDVHNGDIKIRDVGTTRFTFDISSGDFTSGGAVILDGYLGLAGGTFTDADSVFTNASMTTNGDVTIGNNSTGSTNFPTEFGQSLLIKGASDTRDMSLYKAALGDFGFHLGQKDGSNNWEWSEVMHTYNRHDRDWETAGGDTGTEDGADTWARVADFDIDTDFGGGTIDFEINTSNSSKVSDANLTVFIRRNGSSSLVNCWVRLNALNSNDSSSMLDYDSFKIIANSATDIQLWVNKKENFGRVTGKITGKTLITTNETYYTDAAWQSTEPTGSVDNDTTLAITTGNNDKIFHQGLATFDYDGEFTSNKFIMDGKTSDDILLGDGTTTSLSGIGSGGNFLASDGNDTFNGSSGTGITFNDNTFVKFGSSGDLEMKHNTSTGYFEFNFLNNRNFTITEGSTLRVETDWGRNEIELVDTHLTLTNVGGYVEAEAGFKKTGKNNTEYLMAGGGTRYASDGVSFFMVKANTTGQTTTTSNVTLAGMWDTPIISDSVYTFTPSSGELEIDEYGILEINATLTGYQSGNNRHELSAYIYKNGSRYAGTTNYTSRNTVQRSGGVTISALVDCAPSDVITIRVKHVGVAAVIGDSLLPDETFITAKFWSGNQTPA